MKPRIHHDVTVSRTVSTYGLASTPTFADPWIYYRDGTSFKRRLASDVAGALIETLWTNAALTGAYNFDLEPTLGTAGKIGFSDTVNNYEADLSDDSVVDISATPSTPNWHVSDIRNNQWFVGRFDDIYTLPHGSSPGVLWSNKTGRDYYQAQIDLVNNGATGYLVCAARGPGSPGLYRYALDDGLNDTIIDSGFVVDGVALDKTLGLAFYNDRDNNKLWKVDYLTPGTPVEILSGITPSATVIRSMHCDPITQKIYYIVNTVDIRRCDYDGGNDEAVFTITDARFLLVMP